VVKKRLPHSSRPAQNSAAVEDVIDPAAAALIEELPAVRRLALSYATRAAHPPFLALLALDAKFGGVVAAAREPVLAQIKLAWWRERLAAPAAERPRGQPLLAAMTCWGGHEPVLIALVEAWEAMLGNAPDAAGLGEARAAAMRSLAHLVGAGALRPLVVLAGLGQRAARRGQRGLIERPADMLCAIRLGLSGR
jgi:phytoene/squalene synthetase